MATILNLTDAERKVALDAGRALFAATRTHHVDCLCGLCMARCAVHSLGAGEDTVAIGMLGEPWVSQHLTPTFLRVRSTVIRANAKGERVES